LHGGTRTLRQSRSYAALDETHEQVHDLHTRLEPQSRQPRNYEELRRTQYKVDREPSSRPDPGPAPQPGNYEVLRRTQYEVDAQRNSGAAAPEPEAQRPGVQRSWTHHGGMVPQQHSANVWIRQNHEIRMANENSGTQRQEQGAQAGRNQSDPQLQEARAAVEEARRREAAERARTQERDRGPER
jgi:hypothetical protein